MKAYTKYKDAPALHWDWYAKNTHRYAELVDTVLRQFEGREGIVIDVGSGDGLPASLLIKKGFNVYGIEPEDEANEVAKKKVPKMLLYEGTAEEFFAPGQLRIDADFLFSLNVIEHLENPHIFTEAMKWIKNFAVIVTDNAARMKEKSEFHAREFTYRELERIFKDFKTEKIETGNEDFIAIKVYGK